MLQMEDPSPKLIVHFAELKSALADLRSHAEDTEKNIRSMIERYGGHRDRQPCLGRRASMQGGPRRALLPGPHRARRGHPQRTSPHF